MTEGIPETASNAAGTETGDIPFNAEKLIDAVYNSFSAKSRERINRRDIEQVVAEIELDEERPKRKSPALRVQRLRFAGEKHMDGRSPESFIYDQVFAPGVNVICIPDNEVGKSSILKTIKYALTGDNSDYDADVRSWITDVWLTFTLDKQQFTVLLSTREGSPRAMLVAGEELRPIETVTEEASLAIFDATGIESIKAELQRFFFQRLGLGPLFWTQQDLSVPGGVAERSTSWLTYFQALQIPDGGDRYLLCDSQHAMGNQDGLIFSAFLGLHLVKPLNRLGTEASIIRKEIKNEERLTAEQRQQAKEEIARFETELQTVQSRVKEIIAAQATRRRAVEGGEPAQRLIELQSGLLEKANEKAHLESEHYELNRAIQRGRARERQLREAIALQLHFTGLEVSLCPNCDAAVDLTAVEREQTDHTCRLCGKLARGADPADVSAMNAEADDLKRQTAEMLRGREAISARLATLRREIEALTVETDTLKEAAQQGISFALPTQEEEAELGELYVRIGRLQADLAIARQKAESPPPEEDGQGLRVRVVEKVREVLREEANRRNRGVLEQLSALTQETTRNIGAESISGVTCSPLGKVELRKHGQQVSFTGIQNEGERLRIKLAFFLAMMRLGREPGLGRHPGFLSIDQPGSGEMVQEDFEALALIFRRVDEELADHVQIICCTARPEFQAATNPSKIYGPQNPPYAF